jgi:hypothetical protein
VRGCVVGKDGASNKQGTTTTDCHAFRGLFQVIALSMVRKSRQSEPKVEMTTNFFPSAMSLHRSSSLVSCRVTEELTSSGGCPLCRSIQLHASPLTSP